MATELVVTPSHILRSAVTTLTATFYVDGVEADPGAVTLGIVDATGATVVAALAATEVGTTGVRTYALAGQSTLTWLTATWTSDTFGTLDSTHEIVGGFLFSVREARAYDASALQNQTDYPAADIEDARARILDSFEEITGVAFVPRYELVTLDATTHSWNRDVLLIKRNGAPALKVTAVRSVETRAFDTETWTALGDTDLAHVQVEPWGLITHAAQRDWFMYWRQRRQNVRIAFEHGHRAVPGDIKRAALIVLRYTLVPGNDSPRALSVSGPNGTTQYAVANAGLDRHYGIPDVDTILNRYSERVAVIA